MRKLAIAHLGWDVEFPLITDVHLLDGYDPTLDKVAEPLSQGHTAAAAVKLLSVDGPARTVCRDDAACSGLGILPVTLIQNLVIDSR